MSGPARWRASLAALWAIALAAGCGHRVEPTAPYRDASSIPTPSSITASQVPGAVLLSWTVGASPYEYVEGWNVYRRTVMHGPATRMNRALVADVTFEDRTVAEGESYFYSVAAVSPAGVESRATDDIEIRYDSVAPGAPAGLVATPEMNAIRLSWTPSPAPDLGFYRVYRGGGLLADRVADATYLDMPVASDRSHRYEVTAVDDLGNESARSAAVDATALPADDITPPAAPASLGAAPEAGGVRLTWSAVADADLEGYFVYRRRDGDPDFARIPGSSLVSATSFLDATVQNGRSYRYVVTAVDTAGNESPRSVEASATWLAPMVDTGGNDLGSVYPWCGIASNSGRMQFLVPAADIARSGTIASIGLWIRSGAAVYRNVTIQLAHTNAAMLESDFAANRSAAESQVAVYGPATIDTQAARQGSVLPFALAAPFAYDGTRSLLVEIVWNGDDSRTVVFGFRSTPDRWLRAWRQPESGPATTGYEQYQQFIRLVFAN